MSPIYALDLLWMPPHECLGCPPPCHGMRGICMLSWLQWLT
jgi:hypothetical protein